MTKKWFDNESRIDLLGGLALCAVLVTATLAILLAINAWENAGLERAQRVAVGVATLDLFVRPQVYQADRVCVKVLHHLTDEKA